MWQVLLHFSIVFCTICFASMRFPRVKAEGQSFYHCVSRVVDRRFIFQTAGHGSAEAERFVLLMRRLEAFSGVRVLTYALMSNHFHLLCEVPQARELSEAELLDRIQAGYGPARRQALDQELARLRQGPDGADQIQRLLFSARVVSRSPARYSASPCSLCPAPVALCFAETLRSRISRFVLLARSARLPRNSNFLHPRSQFHSRLISLSLSLI